MIADIAVGHSAGADVLFLIAAIVFALAAIAAIAPARTDTAGTYPNTFARFAPFLAYVGLVLIAVGFLIL